MQHVKKRCVVNVTLTFMAAVSRDFCGCGEHFNGNRELHQPETSLLQCRIVGSAEILGFS